METFLMEQNFHLKTNSSLEFSLILILVLKSIMIQLNYPTHIQAEIFGW